MGRTIAWILGVLVALVYPLPFEASGYVYYETVGFLVLLNAMLGIGWNIIGGWAGQFDFGPSIFFAIGAYTAGLLAIHFGWNAWLGLLAAVVVAVVHLRRAHVSDHAAPRALLRDRHRGHVDDRAAHRRDLGAHQRQPRHLHPFGRRGGFVHGMLTMGFPGRGKGLGFYYLTLLLFVLTLWARARSSGRSSASTSARSATIRTAPRPSASTAASTR